MKDKKPWRTVNGLTFMVIISAVGVLSVFLPKPTESEYEGRKLVAFPKFSTEALFSGEFTKQIATHYSDTFPFRETLVELASKYRGCLGINTDDVKIHGTVPDTDTEVTETTPAVTEQTNGVTGETSSETTAPTEATQETEKEGNVDIDGEMKNSIFVIGDRAMSLFGGTKQMSDYYARTISEYQKKFAEKGVKTYNMVVPTQAEFKLPPKYKKLSNSQKDNIDYIYSQMAPEVITVDAYSKLQKHQKEYIYFRTDHHWTPLGAYYAYCAFAESAGFTPVPIADMEKRTKEAFVGSLYRMTQEPALKEHPDYMDYYVPKVEISSKYYPRDNQNNGIPMDLYVEYAKGVNTYSLFMGGDWPLFEINTNAGTGRSIAVVKESFGNAFVPFLTSHYDRIYVVDLRYFEKNFYRFVEDNNIGEVAFVNNAFAANTGIQIDKIKGLGAKPWDYQVPVKTEETTTKPAETSAGTENSDSQTEKSDGTETSPVEDTSAVEDENSSGEENTETIPVIPSEEDISDE